MTGNQSGAIVSRTIDSIVFQIQDGVLKNRTNQEVK